MKKANVIRTLICCSALGFAGGALAQADDYPKRPVRQVIPFAPGGASDFVGRIIAQPLGQMLGQQIISDNRPGAAGNIGMENAALKNLKIPYEFRIMGATEQKIAHLGDIPDNWKVFPFKDDGVVEFLKEIDAFVYLSGEMRESWGRSICEAMLTGLPVICKNRDAMPEYIIGGHNGLLVNDEDELLSAIDLIRDVGKATDIGITASHSMQELMDPVRYVNKLIHICDGTEMAWLNDPRIQIASKESWIIELGQKVIPPCRAYKQRVKNAAIYCRCNAMWPHCFWHFHA